MRAPPIWQANANLELYASEDDVGVRQDEVTMLGIYIATLRGLITPVTNV